jgi:hypothetical protein
MPIIGTLGTSLNDLTARSSPQNRISTSGPIQANLLPD